MYEENKPGFIQEHSMRKILQKEPIIGMPTPRNRYLQIIEDCHTLILTIENKTAFIANNYPVADSCEDAQNELESKLNGLRRRLTILKDSIVE